MANCYLPGAGEGWLGLNRRGGVMLRRISAAIFAICFPAAAPAAAQGADDPFAAFAPYSEASRYQIDHTPWDDFLRRAVFEVGRSDREPARSSGNQFRIAGTRLTTASRSRYRFEGNRVMFHTFDRDVIEYIGLYRDALQDTMNRVDYGDFSRNEQLAYWLNLYNAVVIHEIAKAHPVSRPGRIRAGENGERLYEAKLVTVYGVALSLNDIKYKIVYRYWRDTDVLYGFWDGVIGGPGIISDAFAGDRVGGQLAINGREFVNSMRGVDKVRDSVRISKIYHDARPYFFPDWPGDLYIHLNRHADYRTADILSTRPENPRASRFDINTADAESGETVRPPVSDNSAAVAAGADLGSRWANLSSTAMRGGLSGEALELSRRAETRLSRRTGTVVILDVYTDDPDTPPPQSLTVESDEAASQDDPE